MEIGKWLLLSRGYSIRLPPERETDWLPLHKIGTPQPYAKTHTFFHDYINLRHALLSVAPLGRMGIPICIDLGIDGFLQREEALKLYELAYFNSGDALELGTHHGLSAVIIAGGLQDGKKGRLETVDIDEATNPIAQANVAERIGPDTVTFTLMDATDRLKQLADEGRKFGLIFVDHWHGYNETRDAAELATELLLPGGFVMFHDFLDPGNGCPDHPYGVYQGVLDAYYLKRRMQFRGLFGSSALFQLIV